MHVRPTAEVIAHSIGPYGHEIITWKLRYWRAFHAEFMTHRVFSRNASSSRAVPVKKLLEEVTRDDLRAGPISWATERNGMQGGPPLNAERVPEGSQVNAIAWNSEVEKAEALWKIAANNAVGVAKALMDIGVHKSISNRLLEPFSSINVVCTATEIDNFFGLRLDSGALPEMRMLAEAMWHSRRTSTPRALRPGEWHLPFADDEDAVKECCEEAAVVRPGVNITSSLDYQIKVSVARCARVSYLSFDTGKRSSVAEDLKLYDRLLGSQPLHASPAEHQATPDERLSVDTWGNRDEWGNFVGWRQYRKMLVGEHCAPLPEGYA